MPRGVYPRKKVAKKKAKATKKVSNETMEWVPEWVPTTTFQQIGSISDAVALEQYDSLNNVLERAFDQAAEGKGHERHAQGQSYDKQPMQTISDLIGSDEGMRFQVIKKVQEAARLPREHAVHELLGAINYIAGMIIYLEKQSET